MRDLINLVVDPESFSEYKAEYGQTIVCGYARIGGFTVGIIANQRTAVMTKKEGMQFGGVIYHDSADKEARFIMDCNQTWTPIIFLQDVMGFMVGRDSEEAGIIRAGAKVVNAISNSRVPKITLITGGSLRGRELCDVRKSIRSAVNFRVAKCAIRRDGRQAGGSNHSGHQHRGYETGRTRTRRRRNWKPCGSK